MSDLVVTPPRASLQISEPSETARKYAQASKSEATKRAYASQMSRFAAWSSERGLRWLPSDPTAVGNYLAERAAQGASVATLAQALTAISRANVAIGEPSPRIDPAFREIWAGIVRTEGGKPRKEARALPVDQLRRMCKASKSACPASGARDRALLLLGFAGGFRRSELVGLDVADLLDDPNGLVVTVRRSKTDQTGQGREVAIPYGSDPITCPVRQLRAWLALAGIETGPIFRCVRKGGRVGSARLSDRAVALVLKRAAKRARLPVTGLSGHSLRAGLVTAASQAGAAPRAIMDQTGHKTLAMVVRYHRRATRFEDCAASGLL